MKLCSAVRNCSLEKFFRLRVGDSLAAP